MDKCSNYVQITELMCGAFYTIARQQKAIKTATLQMNSQTRRLKH